jgi:SPP1 Gp6-like portal protein
MALPEDSEPITWVNHLARMHDSDLPDLREKDALFEGTAPLHYLHPDILREVEDRIQVVALGWPSLAVEPLEERLDVLGFRYPEDDEPDPDAAPEDLVSSIGDADLQRVWQDNDLDEESQMGHLDALVMKRAYVTVGTNDAGNTDSPLVTVESPLEMFALVDPRTRQVRAALRRWAEQYDFATQQQMRYATLYLPNQTVWFDQGPQGWRETSRDTHNFGAVCVSALTNRARLADRYGRSELTPPLLSLSHAANKIATDMMVAAEFHAIPLRALFGVGPEDFEDEKGNRLSKLQVIMGRLLTVPDADDGNSQVRAHEFEASSLTNFHDTLNQLGRHAAGLIGVDPSVLGMATGDNPASAEALKSRELRLIKKAERRQRSFGGGWEGAMRLVRRFQEGDWNPAARRLETIWRDAATPTRAQAADAAVKLVGAGKAVIPVQQAREDLGYSPAQQRRMAAQDKANAEMDPIAEIARAMPRQPGVPGVAAPAAEPVAPGVG